MAQVTREEPQGSYGAQESHRTKAQYMSTYASYPPRDNGEVGSWRCYEWSSESSQTKPNIFGHKFPVHEWVNIQSDMDLVHTPKYAVLRLIDSFSSGIRWWKQWCYIGLWTNGFLYCPLVHLSAPPWDSIPGYNEMECWRRSFLALQESSGPRLFLA